MSDNGLTMSCAFDNRCCATCEHFGWPSRTRVLTILLVFSSMIGAAEESVDYLRDVRPILAEHCFQCHGPDAAKRQAGLRLDQRDVAVSRLESGEVAIRPGNASQSELVRRIESVDPGTVMPPPETKRQLTSAQKLTLRKWTQVGAPYTEHWSYRAPVQPKLPATNGTTWMRNGVDPFVLKRIESANLQPSPEADATTLIRRLSLDLTGLPPTVEEVDAFLADRHPAAYERLVDRLLASPHYGEKLALDWLDLARFGDSSGYQDDGDRPNFPYRDYVIGAFNANMPFDQFTIENLAGDLLPGAALMQKVASGFNRLHRHNEEGGSDPEEFQVVYAVDRTNTTATTWMGLTFGCAQCHDHKYDPISQREFYQLYAFFNSLKGEVAVSKAASPPQIRVPGPLDQRQLDQLAVDIAQVDQQKQSIDPLATKAFELWLKEQKGSVTTSGEPITAGSGGGPSEESPKFSVEQILALQPEKRTPEHLARLREHFVADKFPELRDLDTRLAALGAKREAIEKAIPLALIWEEMDQPRPSRILARGDYQHPGESVERDVPAIFPPLESGVPRDRLALARWLVSGRHPLTARVAVNRLWKQCFGAGLVRTAEDFGVRGELPTHPELLDWLATEFVRYPHNDRPTAGEMTDPQSWDTKRLLRLMVTSATYRQSSSLTPQLRERDPDNRMLARGARFRLSAEEIRDAALGASGLLTHRISGRSIYPYQPDQFYRDKEDDPGEWKWPLEKGADLYRRSLYIFIRRTTPYPSFQTFDATSRGECTVARSRTNTPLQALVTMNDPSFVEAARVLGERIATYGADNKERLTFAFRSVLSRLPMPREREVLEQLFQSERERYLADPQAAATAISHGNAPRCSNADPVEVAAWGAVAAALLNVDEAITRE